MNHIKFRKLTGKVVTFAAILSVCVLTAITPVKADTTGKVYTGDGNGSVTVRSGPGTSYDAVGAAPAGTTVTISGSESDGTYNWYKVSFNGVSGYIREDLITDEKKDEIPSGDSATTNDGVPTATLGNDTFQVSERYTAEDIPAGFSDTEVTYQDQIVKCVYNETMDMYLMFLKSDADDSREFYMYLPDTQSFLPFYTLRSGNYYVVALNGVLDTSVLTNFTVTTLPGDDTGCLTGYKDENGYADCYYIFGKDQNGNTGWYLYDAAYQSFSKVTEPVAPTVIEEVTNNDEAEQIGAAYTELKDKYQAEKNKYTKMVIGLIIGCAVLLIILINVIIFGRNGGGDVFDDEDEIPTEKTTIKVDKKPTEESEEEVPEEKTKKQLREEKKKEKKEKRRKKKDFWDIDENEDDLPIWYTERGTEKTGEEEIEDQLKDAVGDIMEEQTEEKQPVTMNTIDLEAALAEALQAEISSDDSAEEEPELPTIELPKDEEEIPEEATVLPEIISAEESLEEAVEEVVPETVEEAIPEVGEAPAEEEEILPEEIEEPFIEKVSIAVDPQIVVPSDPTIDLSDRIIQDTINEALKEDEDEFEFFDFDDDDFE